MPLRLRGTPQENFETRTQWILDAVAAADPQLPETVVADVVSRNPARPHAAGHRCTGGVQPTGTPVVGRSVEPIADAEVDQGAGRGRFVDDPSSALHAVPPGP